MLKINLKKTIDDELLFSCDLQLDNGYYLINGENGSGKSTLFNIIAKYDSDYTGDILLNEKNLKDVDQKVHRNESICYFLQQIDLFEELNCKQNLEIIVGNVEEKKLNELLSILNFESIFNGNKKVKKLSGGEKQKLNIIINFFRNCDVYLLDEIENNLDQATKEHLIDVISQLDGIVLIISHNPIYYQGLDPKRIEVVNKKFELVYEPIEVSDKLDDDRIRANNRLANKNRLDAIDLKLLGKYGRYNRILVGCIIFIMVISLSYVASNVLLITQYIVKPQENFTEGVSLVAPPLNSVYYDALGDESWLENTPYNFTAEDLETIRSFEYVDEVIPIAENGGYASSAALYQGENVYYYEANTDFSALDYNKYNMNEFQSNQIVTTNIVNMIFPQVYYQNTPFNSALSMSDLMYGQYPQDQTNEILISQFTAMELANKLKLNNLEELIGENVSVPLENTNTKKNDNFDFTISGIYTLSAHNGNNYSDNPIYVAYNPGDEIVQRNNCSLYTENQFQAYDICLKISSGMEMDQELTDEQRDQIGDYPMLYVKVDNQEAEKELVYDLKQYDPYIHVDNNYSRSQATSFVYLRTKVLNSLLLVVIILSIFSLLLIGIYKLFMVENHKIEKVLNNFGFTENTYNDFINLEFKKTKVLASILMIGLQGCYLLIFGLDLQYIILLLILDIISYILMSKILRRRNHGQKNII